MAVFSIDGGGDVAVAKWDSEEDDDDGCSCCCGGGSGGGGGGGSGSGDGGVETLLRSLSSSSFISLCNCIAN